MSSSESDIGLCRFAVSSARMARVKAAEKSTALGGLSGYLSAPGSGMLVKSSARALRKSSASLSGDRGMVQCKVS